MKEVVIISGKGGTGKTSITAALASLANNTVFADCDVDAADLHLVLNPAVIKETDFSGGSRAEIISDKCTGCGICARMCRFDAIKLNGPPNGAIEKTYQVDPISCEGCKVCVEFCPTDAISFEPAINGKWFVSDTRFGSMVHARLGIAEENSGKLVTLIRKEAKKIAEEQGKDFLICDGSPGTGCPVIASITGADLVVVVTEPTLSGQHDLDRVVSLTESFGIQPLICINKADINPQLSDVIKSEARRKGIKVIAELPYDDAFTKAQMIKSTLIEYSGGATTQRLRAMWREVIYVLG